MRLLGWLAAIVAAAALPASAQDFPSKPIRIIAPFGPGTATDTVARVIGNEIGKLTGQAVVIENKPGAEGQIGAQAAATAAPDGYTIFITTQTTQAINPHVYKSPDLRPGEELHAGLRHYARRADRDGEERAAGEDGGGVHRAGEEGTGQALLRQRQRLQPRRRRAVPRHGQDRPFGRALQVAAPGHQRPSGRPHRHHLLGLHRGPAGCARRPRARPRRHQQKPIPGLEQFPTVDSTVPGFEMWAWTAAYVPAGTPRPIVDKLNALVREAMKSEGYLTLTRDHLRHPVPRHARGARGLPGQRDQEVGRDRHRGGDAGALAGGAPLKWRDLRL